MIHDKMDKLNCSIDPGWQQKLYMQQRAWAGQQV